MPGIKFRWFSTQKARMRDIPIIILYNWQHMQYFVAYETTSKSSHMQQNIVLVYRLKHGTRMPHQSITYNQSSSSTMVKKVHR